MLMGKIGPTIKKLRNRQGYTQERLAALVGKDRTVISRYETEAIEDIPISTLRKIAKALKIHIGEFFA